MASKMGLRLYPSSVRVYSTRGGTSGQTVAGEQAAILHLTELRGEDFLAHAAALKEFDAVVDAFGAWRPKTIPQIPQAVKHLIYCPIRKSA